MLTTIARTAATANAVAARIKAIAASGGQVRVGT